MKSPHVCNVTVAALPPEGAHASLGAARQES
jgi:hypothetical protein